MIVRLLFLLAVTGITWNLENFFDWTAGTDGTSDVEFSSEGARHWTKGRFYRKCSAVAKTILAASDSFGDVPDFVAVEEVENSFVVSQIVRSTPLSKIGYKYIHYDSFDHRGIDCALLYRPSALRLLSSKPCHICNPDGTICPTRDILLAVFMTRRGDSLAILVNHHPSKVGSSGAEARALVMERLRMLRDSLASTGIRQIVALGDFNDDIWRPVPAQTSPGPVPAQTSPGPVPAQGNPELSARDTVISCPGRDPSSLVPTGTIKYNGAWEKIDGYLGWGVAVEEHIFAFPPLLTQDRAWGGMKPLRTYSGPRYLGGVSDHLPLFLTIQPKS